jgi:hypothetical protein
MPGGSTTTFVAPPPSKGGPRGRPFFLQALLAGVLIYGLVLALVGVKNPSVDPVRFPPVYVHYSNSPTAAAGAALREQALLFDSEPLFLPTTWNYASRLARPQNVRPRPVFPDYTTQVKPPGEAPLRLQSRLFATDTTPLAALQPGQWDVFNVFGLAPSLAPPLPARGALLRVTRFDAGAAAANPVAPLVLEESWAPAEAPRSTQNLQALWGPATFLVLFSATGEVGQPLLINSTGIYAVDDDLRARLDARFRRHPLPPGTYQAVIGP